MVEEGADAGARGMAVGGTGTGGAVKQAAGAKPSACLSGVWNALPGRARCSPAKAASMGLATGLVAAFAVGALLRGTRRRTTAPAGAVARAGAA